MEWLFEQAWVRTSIIIIVILLVLVLIAFLFAAFESEHYTNSMFRAGKKISFKTAFRNNLIGLGIVVLVLGISFIGVRNVYEDLELLPKILISIGVPLLSMLAAVINAKNEKYLFLKIKDFSEGFLTTFSTLFFVMGCIGYYNIFFS